MIELRERKGSSFGVFVVRELEKLAFMLFLNFFLNIVIVWQLKHIKLILIQRFAIFFRNKRFDILPSEGQLF